MKGVGRFRERIAATRHPKGGPSQRAFLSLTALTINNGTKAIKKKLVQMIDGGSEPSRACTYINWANMAASESRPNRNKSFTANRAS